MFQLHSDIQDVLPCIAAINLSLSPVCKCFVSTTCTVFFYSSFKSSIQEYPCVACDVCACISLFIYLFSQALPCCSVACQGCTHLHSFLYRVFLVSCSCDGPVFFIYVIRKQWQQKFSDAGLNSFTFLLHAFQSSRWRRKNMLVKYKKKSLLRGRIKNCEIHIVLFF